RAETEVREERLLRDLDRAAQPALRALQVLPLVEQHAVENRGVEMVRLHFERALEIRLRAVEIAVVEEHLAEEERELVVVAVEAERLLEMLHPAIGVEPVERRLGIGDEQQESLALLAAEQRDHPVLPLGESLLFLEREHLLAHLRFPQLD